MANDFTSWVALGVQAYDVASGRTGVVQLLRSPDGEINAAGPTRVLLRPLTRDSDVLPWWARTDDLRKASELRLLPWDGPDGKPCYLDADPDGDGFLSRYADDVETRRLSEGARLLASARAMLGEPSTATAPQVRHLADRLCTALRASLLVAESRGRRLGGTEDAGCVEPGSSDMAAPARLRATAKPRTDQ